MLSVGEILKAERKKQAIDLKSIEKQLKVREKFLKAVEDNNWKIFSSKIYIIGIIRNYSNFLGLDVERMLAFFRRDYEKTDEVKFKKRITSKYLTPETKKIILIGIVAIFLLFLGYFSYQLKLYFSPPVITIISPRTFIFKKETRIKIVGKTEKDLVINIFGERVYLKEGKFEYDLPLQPGKNELIIEAIGANGRKSIIKKTFYKENN
jgi:hypothetical protein